MLIYEVNLEVNPEIEQEYALWLKGHIQELLALDGFTNAQCFRRNPQDENLETASILWTVQYHLKDRASYEDYLANHAQHFREEGIKHFGGKFKATRRVLTPVE